LAECVLCSGATPELRLSETAHITHAHTYMRDNKFLSHNTYGGSWTHWLTIHVNGLFL